MPWLWCVYERNFETSRPQIAQEWSTRMNRLMAVYKASLGARKFTLRLGVALALGATLTGCAVGPKYQRPTVKLQPFHNAPSIEARTTSLPAPSLDQWWTGFRDPELTLIVNRALEQNLDLAAAITRVQQARAAAQGAGARRMPSGNLYASTTTLYQSTESMTGRLASHLPGYSRPQNYYDLGFIASWETDLVGGLNKGAQAATAEAQAGTYAAELGSVADIPDVPQISGYGTPTDLLRRRPDIIAAERMVAASNARIGQALSEYYPKLSVSGIVGSQALAPAHLFEQQGFQPISVVGLRWRVFDFGAVAAEVKRARGANAEALLQYQSSALHAAEDVEDAFSLLVQSENRRNEILHEIAELQRVRDLSEESYAAGVIALTDVLDADRQLLAAKDDLAVARESAARAAVGSYRALGGGWLP